MSASRRSTPFAFALALVLAPAAPAAAADAPLASFKAPGRSAVGETIVLDARASQSSGPLEWFVDGPKGVEKTAPDAKNEMALIIEPPAGTYRVFLTAVDPSGKKHMAFRAIEVGAAPPAPPPGPAPRARLKVPDRLPVGSHILLDATESRSVGPIVWKVEGPRDLVAAFSPDPKSGPAGSLGVIFNAPAGKYAVTAAAVGEGGTPADVDGPFVVTVSDAEPLPPDLPGPSPVPGYQGQISAVLLVDLDDVPAGHASLVSRDNVIPHLNVGRVTYKVMDVRSPEFAGSAYQQYLAGGFLDPMTQKVAPKVATPALVLNDEGGAFLACDPAPGTPKGVAERIRRIRIAAAAAR